VYLRLRLDNAVGSYAGNIVMSSTNATNVNLATISSTVTSKALTISGVTANNKVFDGNTTATLTGTAVLNGLIAGDVGKVTLGGTPVATFASSAVGTGIAVGVTGYTISGTAASNYIVSQPTGLTANITAVVITPTISRTGTISSLTAIYGSASTSTNFNLLGTNMQSGVLVTPPSGFEVSTNNTTFSNTVTVGAAGTIASTTVYLRLKSDNAVGSYAGNIVMSSTNATNVNLATISSTVTAKALTISGVTANNKVFDGNTTATLTGTAVLNGLISGDVGKVTIGGTPVATFASSGVGTGIAVVVTGYTISGTAASNYTVSQPTGLTANITAVVSVPTILLAGTFVPFSSCVGTVSTTQNFTISGTNLIATIILTAPTGFEISSTQSGSYSSSITLNPTAGTLALSTVYIRQTSIIVGPTSGTISATSNSANQQSLSVAGLVNALPIKPVISWNNNQLNTASGFSSYQWFLAGNPVTGATSNTITPISTGVYTVKITNSFGCSNISDSYNLVVTAITPINISGSSVKVYPNPTSNEVIVSFDQTISEIVTIKLFNSLGAIVNKIETKQKINKLSVQFLPKGIYYIEILNGKQKGSVRLLIQ